MGLTETIWERVLEVRSRIVLRWRYFWNPRKTCQDTELCAVYAEFWISAMSQAMDDMEEAQLAYDWDAFQAAQDRYDTACARYERDGIYET